MTFKQVIRVIGSAHLKHLYYSLFKILLLNRQLSLCLGLLLNVKRYWWQDWSCTDCTTELGNRIKDRGFLSLLSENRRRDLCLVLGKSTCILCKDRFLLLLLPLTLLISKNGCWVWCKHFQINSRTI